MAKEPTHFLKGTARHYVRVVAFAVFGVALGALLVLEVLPQPIEIHQNFESKGEVSTSSDTTTIRGPILASSSPVHLSIPKVWIEADFEDPLGLNADQTAEVPDSFEKVGWYKYSPTPGALGPSVILGHVDSYQGPAVFFSIGQLDPGDEIFITRADGEVATFEVTALERFDQAGFPTELVYGDIDHAGLRLITCSGTYDQDTLRYSHNLVVFAELVTEEEAE